MNVLSTIFLHEWQQLLRQRWLLLSLLFFIAIGLMAVWSGNQVVMERSAQIDSIRVSYQKDLAAVIDKLSDTASANSAGLAVMVNYRLPQHAVKPPAPLSALSLGLMDIQPWYQQVKYTKSYNEVTDMPVSNPMTLFSGNFDLAFVIIYLLPLLVIIYCYALYAVEKENGTLPLLTIQAGSIHKIIRLKLLFRFIVLGVTLMLLNGMAFLLANKQSPAGVTSVLIWSLLSVLYLLFWTAIAYAVIALQKNAGVSGLYMVSTWLFILVICPSLVNTYVQSLYPMPMKDEIASYRRHEGEKIWGTPARILSDSFNRYNPQYASGINVAKDTLHLSKRYVAGYYELLERRMNRVIIPFEEKLQQRNQHFEILSSWNPALQTQHLFNHLSGTQLSAYQAFALQTDQYQQVWKSFLYDFHFADKMLRVEDFRRIPVFRYQAPVIHAMDILRQCLYMIILVSGLFIAGFILFRKRNKPA